MYNMAKITINATNSSSNVCLQIYKGNSDSESVVVRQIKPVLKSRYVRIIPLTWHKRAALRLEFSIKSEDIDGEYSISWILT